MNENGVKIDENLVWDGSARINDDAGRHPQNDTTTKKMQDEMEGDRMQMECGLLLVFGDWRGKNGRELLL